MCDVNISLKPYNKQLKVGYLVVNYTHICISLACLTLKYKGSGQTTSNTLQILEQQTTLVANWFDQILYLLANIPIFQVHYWIRHARLY